jgi:para-nitrobenzyl esterase
METTVMLKNDQTGRIAHSMRKAACRLAPIALLVCFAGCSTTATGFKMTDIVHTTSGPVQGQQVAQLDEFLGIPYAAPPVGNLRWRPPAPVTPSRTTLHATQFAPTCAQAPRGAFASPSESEDCLYLNVFKPRNDEANTHRPVMVWIHGGGLFSGESNDYDASALVRAGAIVVTFNYRIGALGFLSQSALNKEGHAYANYGFMDQQAALRWVQSNISAFGGDPHNVTIFGQSGGGTSVIAQIASPTAAGLFQRAIVQSGTRVTPYTKKEALDAGTALAAAAGCANQSAQCLRALDVRQILKYQAKIAGYLGTHYPVTDGTIVVHTAQQAFETGAFNRVPIISGLVADEQAFFLPEILKNAPPLSAAGYEQFLDAFGTANRAALKAAYPLNSFANPSEAEIAAAQDLKICTARYLNRNWSKYVPVYAYSFDDRDAPSYLPPVSYKMGAYHTAELQYLFPLFHGGAGTAHPLNASQQDLANLMTRDWVRFAAKGVPSDSWSRYDASADDVMHFETRTSAVTALYGVGRHCDLWDPIALGTAR